MNDSELPAVYHVVLYSPGVNWDERFSFHDQVGARDHLTYLETLARRGVLAMAGPYLDDTGCMAVLQGLSPEQARLLAYADPAVRFGLLEAEVRPWLVPVEAVATPIAGSDSSF